MTEFELIRRYFVSQPVSRPDVRLGVGDDAAVVMPPAGTETVITTDTLVAGVHFFPDVDPEALGHKSLAVNLSDLAAMGAAPAWFLLNVTLPDADAAWLDAFARGLHGLAERYAVQLVGGDTTRGPLCITITAIGLVPQGAALRRSGARPGDAVYATGTVGDAAAALAECAANVPTPQRTKRFHERLERPTPRVAEGMALRAIASSAIDISDGLLADLAHILTASRVGARLQLEALPLSDEYRARKERLGWDAALAGGDDYELCFTVSPERLGALTDLVRTRGFSVTRIGEITAGGTLEVVDAAGRRHEPPRHGYEHFTTTQQR